MPLHGAGRVLRDYAIRVWDNSGEDNITFLAGGIAFNIILAAVPFTLLLVTVATYLLPWFQGLKLHSPSDAVVGFFMDRMLPADSGGNASIRKVLDDILQTRKSIGTYSAVGFIWFSTRLFGSLRSVLASVFDIDADRGIIAGKIFDAEITVVSTVLFVVSMALTAYVQFATASGGRVLVALGIRKDVMGHLQYSVARLVAFSILALMFFALYRYLPVRRVRVATAWVAALFTSVMFEAARIVFGAYAAAFHPGSLYTGTLTAVVVVVVWCYYAALIFILGGEIAQVYELRRMRAVQREVFTDP